MSWSVARDLGVLDRRIVIFLRLFIDELVIDIAPDPAPALALAVALALAPVSPSPFTGPA